MASIHPTAIISSKAILADNVEIGPYSIVGDHVKIGKSTKLLSHVVVDGYTTIGAGCTLFPFASIGGQTQDLKYKGGEPGVIIGDRTTLREYVTVNAATHDGDFTRVGSDCHIMAYAHIAHDCVVGNRVIIANAGTLAGHVTIEDQVIVGGLCGIHQFVRLGRLSIIGGCSKATQDVPPFMMADGNPALVHTINSVGLKRAGFSDTVQKSIKQAFRILYRKDLTISKALAEMEKEIEKTPEIQHLMGFVKASERGIAR